MGARSSMLQEEEITEIQKETGCKHFCYIYCSRAWIWRIWLLVPEICLNKITKFVKTNHDVAKSVVISNNNFNKGSLPI